MEDELEEEDDEEPLEEEEDENPHGFVTEDMIGKFKKTKKYYFFFFFAILKNGTLTNFLIS